MVKLKVDPAPTTELDLDVAAHQGDQVAADRQTEAGAAMVAADRAVQLGEALEQPLELVCGDAGARVADGQAQQAVGGVIAGGDGDAAAGGELDGVAQQVEQHLAQPRAVGVDEGRQVRVQAHLQRQPLVGRLRRHQRQRALDELHAGLNGCGSSST